MKRLLQTIFICVVALILFAYVIFQYYHNTCDESDVVYNITTVSSAEIIWRNSSNKDGVEITLSNGEQYKYPYNNFGDENNALIQDAIQAQNPVRIGVANGKIYHLEIDDVIIVSWETRMRMEKMGVIVYSFCIFLGTGAIIIMGNYNYHKKYKNTNL